jgi:hypothetical protein
LYLLVQRWLEIQETIFAHVIRFVSGARWKECKKLFKMNVQRQLDRLEAPDAFSGYLGSDVATGQQPPVGARQPHSSCQVLDLQVAPQGTLPFFDREGHLSADGRFH